eukprot:Tbor_TRINITY_DN4277_c0_g1::TRINITY_DN4277_c0_g1_i1::g.24053::m.24053/K17267/COPG; coatomer subunit gamma
MSNQVIGPIPRSHRHEDYEDEEYEPLPFEGIEKSAVLQQCREFSAIHVNVKNCMISMVKVLYLLNNGITLTQHEATEVFFAATKLFQNEDPKLRRLLFLLMKELSGIADQVFMACQSVANNMNSSNDTHRCHAIRTLRKLTDATMMSTMDRFLKQAIVDRNNNVVSAAIVTGIHLSHLQPELTKRWLTEVKEALSSRGSKVQYHALALLHRLNKGERIHVLKMVQMAQNGPIRAPLPLCLLIRMCTELIQEDFQQYLDLYKFVTSLLHHSADMVVFEAAHSICSLRNVTAKEVLPAVLAVSPYLASSKSTLRFTAVRLLSRIATTHPSAVTPINGDIETLVGDTNRNISTQAITILLKIGNEFAIDRLLRQMKGQMMAEMSEECKVAVVDSMRVISKKFPQKFPTIIEFLFTTLKDEGGGSFKHNVIESMLYISRTNPAARESVLTCLAEFIEDCEFPFLVKRVLCLIGEEGPRSENPRQFIRYVYNHVQLERPLIRAVAISTLAKFAAGVPELRKIITILLKRTLTDPDDEVRDRAVFYYQLFTHGDEVAINTLVDDVASQVNKERDAAIPKPAITRELEEVGTAVSAEAAATITTSSGASAQVTGPSLAVVGFREKMHRVPELKSLGDPLCSTEPVNLTDADNELAVSLAKHFFSECIVFQFKVMNTMDNISIHNFNILTDMDELENCTPQYTTVIDTIEPHKTGYGYVVVSREVDTFPSGCVRCSCSFSTQEGDEELSDPEELPMDEFAVNVSDYITPIDLSGGYEKQFTAFKDEETVDSYSLKTMKSLTMAAHAICDFFGMHIQGGRPEKITTKSQTINMSGVMADSMNTLILVSGKVFIAADQTVALELVIRGGTEDLRNFLSAALVS